ncbi:glutamate racemase [Aegicerativicinus sediminis]
MSKKPIGLFDSGVGGTSIFRAIHSLLPFENTIYLADSKNAPYGEKSKEDIIALSKKNTELLLDFGCKLIVVACNTATTNAIKTLREKFTLPFIGIEPAIKPAALKTNSGTIGILATKGTLSSELFNSTFHQHASHLKVIEQVGEGIVELIENGQIYSKEMEELLESYMQPMISANIDYLVLGCTHYPYIIPMLRKLLPENVTIIDSGEAVARQTKNVLIQHDLLRTEENLNPKNEFYTNGKVSVLSEILNGDYPVTFKNF